MSDVNSRSAIPYVNLAAQFEEERDEILAVISRVLAGGMLIGGREISELEGRLAALCGVEHAVALNSGTDALILGLRALGIGPGDEVITPPNSFIASTAAIVAVGATPIFADVLPDQNIDPAAIEAVMTPRTKAIMPVHLTGRICDMNAIMRLARNGIHVIEDAAQSIGSTFNGRPAGSFGTLGCFSTHPLKNLNAIGDGGFVTTSDATIAERIRRLRNHGLIDRDTVAEFGVVSRMDTVKAAVLMVRLKRLPSTIAARRRNAQLYREFLDRSLVFVPDCGAGEFNTFHTFVIQTDRRDELKKYLADQGIATAIHYPIPIHLQPAAKALGHRKGDFPVTERQAERILTLPVNEYTTESDVRRVADTVNAFHQKRTAA